LGTISFNSQKLGKGEHPLEVEIQKACWAWLGRFILPHRSLEPSVCLQTFCYMVPNGVQLGGGRTRRAQYMASLKAQGFRPGVSDMVIAYPMWADYASDCYHGAYIELKRDPEAYRGPAARASALKPEQRDWLELMSSVGYWAAVAYGLEDFKSLVNSYLKQESPRPLDFIPGQ